MVFLVSVIFNKYMRFLWFRIRLWSVVIMFSVNSLFKKCDGYGGLG